MNTFIYNFKCTVHTGRFSKCVRRPVKPVNRSILCHFRAAYQYHTIYFGITLMAAGDIIYYILGLYSHLDDTLHDIVTQKARHTHKHSRTHAACNATPHTFHFKTIIKIRLSVKRRQAILLVQLLHFTYHTGYCYDAAYATYSLLNKVISFDAKRDY